MDSEQEERIKDAMEKARYYRKWAKKEKPNHAALAIAYTLSAIAERLASIDKTLTYLAEVIELKGQSRY